MVIIKCCIKYRGAGLILFPLNMHTVSETARWFDNSVSDVLFALEELLYCFL